MPECRIIIAVSNPTLSKKLRVLLQSNGYMVIDEAANAADCMRKIRAAMPDVIIVSTTLSGMSTYSLVKVVLEEKLAYVVALAGEGNTATSLSDFTNRVEFEMINAPVNTGVLLNTIYMMYKSSVKLRALEEKVTQLEESLETRKLMDKAKGVLMKYFKIDENEAHRRIQKTSMDTGMGLKEVAKIVIDKYK